MLWVHLRRLQSSDFSTRCEAARRICGSQSPRAIEALALLLRDDSQMLREIAGSGLKTVGWKPSDEEERAWFAAAIHDFEQLGGLGSVAVEPLLRAIIDECWGHRTSERSVRFERAWRILEQVSGESNVTVWMRIRQRLAQHLRASFNLPPDIGRHCDICSAQFVQGRYVPNLEFKYFVRLGYNPVTRMLQAYKSLELLKQSVESVSRWQIFLLSNKAEWYEAWSVMVKNNSTDWVLCSDCTEDVRHFLDSTTKAV